MPAVGQVMQKYGQVVIRVLAGIAPRAGAEQHDAFDPIAVKRIKSATEARQRRVVGNRSHEDFCHRAESTFITSSPGWLMTLTAMRPDLGFGNGREVSLLRLDQASSSISALRVVFSAL
jgi:hypothetical protein